MGTKNNKITVRLSDEILKKYESVMPLSGYTVHNDFITHTIVFYSYKSLS